MRFSQRGWHSCVSGASASHFTPSNHQILRTCVEHPGVFEATQHQAGQRARRVRLPCCGAQHRELQARGVAGQQRLDLRLVGELVGAVGRPSRLA